MPITINGQFVQIDDSLFNRDEIRSVKKLRRLYKSSSNGQVYGYVVQVQYGALGNGPKAPSTIWLSTADGESLISILMRKENNAGSNTNQK